MYPNAKEASPEAKLPLPPAKELVPGDVVVLETGDYVAADIRLTEVANLKAQEASLTGESVPVEKDTQTIEEEKVGIGDIFSLIHIKAMMLPYRKTVALFHRIKQALPFYPSWG